MWTRTTGSLGRQDYHVDNLDYVERASLVPLWLAVIERANP